MAGVAAVASLAVSVYSAKKQQEAQDEARQQERKAQEKQEAKEKAQLAESRRQQMREERVRRAQILQRSANLGVTRSSGEVGAVSNVTARTGGNLSFQTGQGMFSTSISKSLQKASDFQSTANQWGRIGQTSQSVFSSSGGFSTIFD